MKNIVHIKSKIPAKISINGEEIFQQQIDILSTRDFYVAFFPDTIDRYLPCATAFYGNIRPICISKIPFKNNHYDLIYNPALVPTAKNEANILSKKYNNTLFSVTNSLKSFVSITNNHFSHTSTTDLLKNISFKSVDGYAVIYGKITDDKQYLLVFNTKKNIILLEDTYNKVEISNTSIKALKLTDSISGYGNVYEFSLSTKGVSKYSIFAHNSSHKVTTTELIPLAFLESIKYGDFKTAKSYLNNENINSEYFKNYFGEIKEIYFNPYSEDINYTILSDKFKSFTFYVENQKILDIEENPLNIV